MPTMLNGKSYYTISEIATDLGIARQNVLKSVYKRKLAATKVASRFLVCSEDYIEFQSKRRNRQKGK